MSDSLDQSRSLDSAPNAGAEAVPSGPAGPAPASQTGDPDGSGGPPATSSEGPADAAGGAAKRRRGSRGGRGRGRSGTDEGAASDGGGDDGSDATTADQDAPLATPEASRGKPRIGDTRPAPALESNPTATAPSGTTSRKASSDTKDSVGGGSASGQAATNPNRRRRGSGGGGGPKGGGSGTVPNGGSQASGGRRSAAGAAAAAGERGSTGGGARRGATVVPVHGTTDLTPVELGDDELNRRKGRERKGRPVGRYLMVVSVKSGATQISVLEGRNLIEHYVSRPADDVFQIHGNIYLGKVQNVLPGMEAAFIDIATPKNAVLYRGDVQYDKDDVDGGASQGGGQLKIEQILHARQNLLCQVTKNPIAHKGARLTQEVSIPGRFVVLIPNSNTYGISKRLPDAERKRLRQILDRVRPKGHGLIVRTAAENVTAEEIERDVHQIADQWQQIEKLANTVQAPALLYREPDMAVRMIREEFNQDYRGIVIDDRKLFDEIHAYVAAISPALADRVQFYDPAVEPLTIHERHHVHEQLMKAVDRKVWLPSGGSLVIEHTEALTVIDVNTGKNVGSSSLEETVYINNLEAAEEIAKQLRLRDIGGIIVCDFIDMEIEANKRAVIKAFRAALARDKTRTQVFDISDLGLVEMTRKRIGEGLLESVSMLCATCDGRGVAVDADLLA